MHGLAYFHEDEVGDVDHIVDGADAHGAQFGLQPFGRVGHMYVLQRDACIAGTEGGLFHRHTNGARAGLCL